MQNREIKFRAWDKDNNNMHYSDSQENDIIWNIDNQGVFFEEFGHEYNLIEGGMVNCQIRPDQILMQYTGRKDKRGKQIYESDIWQKGTYPYDRITVVFSKGKFNIATYDTEKGKVIGNIYKNPELIEEVKK